MRAVGLVQLASRIEHSGRMAGEWGRRWEIRAGLRGDGLFPRTPTLRKGFWTRRLKHPYSYAASTATGAQ